MDQDETPYLDALVDLAEREVGRFHIPGHKGGRGADARWRKAVGDLALALDFPAGTEDLDIGPDPLNTPFQQAQRLAAEAWGARRSWFLVNGASGGNHAICMALAHLGEVAIVQRNVHSSVIDGLVLSGLKPRFVAPAVDDDLGIANCMTVEALERALDEDPLPVAVFVVSPTYFGAVADVAALAEAAHARNVPLVVDESWGAHLAFSDELPANALACGADVVLNSVHKLGGSLTQSAILHLGTERIDGRIVDRSVTLVETTSPSALLTASLDAARRHNVVDGHELLSETIASLKGLRRAVVAIDGLDVLDEEIAEAPSVFAWDPLRLSVDVRGTGATGNEIARHLRLQHDIWLELYAENVIVAVFGIGEEVAETGKRLIGGLRDAVEQLSRPVHGERAPFAPPPPWGPTVMTPRAAFLGDQEVVPFSESTGRIAAESLAAYPPGVPNVLPGERLSDETIDFIEDSLAHGGQVRGASDRTLRTVRVVVEE
ncbi:MAG: aminotransferase class I/II-fold pyridoxal phosphate-dependent enzyme [Solirubrobacterales bacterium]|nr:aminotransferase class I/II-fold pyridoxal phosphate-dependent enzyme [Solirubrobacterales bacterium]MCB8971456.1 aminotransferase class I/II-fold pyridoxal phosphate-dependent enzyme [Thermoleophilales bacterium]MCO5327132.1 aminotransferase class I/II-fold pyridoxal phosphate-dependent enzyme [Solirubrobacterales bacterium]